MTACIFILKQVDESSSMAQELVASLIWQRKVAHIKMNNDIYHHIFSKRTHGQKPTFFLCAAERLLQLQFKSLVLTGGQKCVCGCWM